jgi:hypothetical protein
MIIHYVFLGLAIAFFLIAGFGVSHPKVNFGWLGLAFFAVAFWLRA